MAEKLAPEKRHAFVHNGQKVFEWDQTLEEVNMYIELPKGVPTKLFRCTIQAGHVDVGIRGNPPYLNVGAPPPSPSSPFTRPDAPREDRFVVLDHRPPDVLACYSEVSNMINGDHNTEDGEMHITLQKREKGKTWSSPIQGQGLLDPYAADQEQKRLMLQRFQEERHSSLVPALTQGLSWEEFDQIEVSCLNDTNGTKLLLLTPAHPVKL
ncbi:hypothetical protein ACP4OV_010213 [Aristida adscensionis]